jgi:hypothetical protein
MRNFRWFCVSPINAQQGLNPVRKADLICSSLLKESAGLSNFISKEIGTLALKAAADHSALREKSGIIEIERLRTNLLSSQPLCFNFFGLISLDHELGLKVVQSFYPEISAFHGVFFEYAPIPKRICSPPPQG